MNYEEQAERIADQAFNKFEKRPEYDEGSFPMFSYDRFSQLIIQGIAESLLEKGFEADLVKAVLDSKSIRHGLDQDEEELIMIGRAFADIHDLEAVAESMRND